MRTALLTLTGLVAFTLCPTTCPMNTGITSDAHAMHRDMHEGHDVHADASESPCEHCEINSSFDLALSGLDAITDVPMLASVALVWLSSTPTEPPIVHKTETAFAATGPPIAPSIVRTIVLRT